MAMKHCRIKLKIYELYCCIFQVTKYLKKNFRHVTLRYATLFYFPTKQRKRSAKNSDRKTKHYKIKLTNYIRLYLRTNAEDITCLFSQEFSSKSSSHPNVENSRVHGRSVFCLSLKKKKHYAGTRAYVWNT